MRLEARALRKVFRSGDGVHDVSLSVAPGEIHALVGLNGAGKSTLMRLILGMLTPDAGTVRIEDTDIQRAPLTLWAGVGHLSEAPFAYPELTVTQNLRMAARLHGLSGRASAAAAADIIAELNLGKYADRRVSALSLGNKQRVGLAAALQHDALLIVLDEPSNALDPSGVILLRTALERRAATGAGVFVSSHHLDEVARVADTITVIDAGRVVGSLDPKGVDIERAFFTLVHESQVEA